MQPRGAGLRCRHMLRKDCGCADVTCIDTLVAMHAGDGSLLLVEMHAGEGLSLLLAEMQAGD